MSEHKSSGSKGGRSQAEAQMTDEEMEKFLTESRIAALGTVRKDGRPYVDPIGFVYRDGAIYLSIDGRRVLLTRIRNNCNVFLSVFDDGAPHAAAVQIEGVAEFVDDPDHEVSLSIVRRYAEVGEELPKYEQLWLGGGQQGAGRQLLKLVPTRMFGWDGKKTAAYRRRQTPPN